MYVYVQSEPQLYTVGFYDPSGRWHADSDHENKQQAAARAHWLNGGKAQQEADENPMYDEYKERYGK